MCALTFLPKGKNEFIITSNRDEGAMRKPALPPEVIEVDGVKILCPIDGEAGGTWIAISEGARALCVLNGAFIAHQHNPPYRISRGLMVKDSFRYASIEDFIAKYNFSGIEPFTLVCFDAKKETVITELRWDGAEKFVKTIDASTSHIWSSASLYTAEAQKKRQDWFNEWLLANEDFKLASIREFHHFAGDEDESISLVMNRNNVVMTVSITSIMVRNDEATIIYEDLKTDEIFKNTLELKVPHSTPA